ncbi:MAG: sugar ABC transporter permease [Treponema sp.]|nr:sugar ABC transporter permease [Treponema sp.]MBQ3800899.1 sugar ABC transporter permease [Treponema sp.]
MNRFLKDTWKHRAYLVMALPAVLVLLFFNYIPMAGLVLAFKKFDYTKGIWGSPFNGLENFRFLFQSRGDFTRITRNTLMYYVIFTTLGTFLNIVLAVAIDQYVFKRAGKFMQTIMIIPVFVSYAAVQFIVMAYISSGTGIINNLLGGRIPFYRSPQYWPYILTIVKIWNSVGYGSVLYMSVLAGVDQSLYEAAKIDGANKWQQIRYITLPALIPMTTVMLLLSVGGIMRSDTGLFYQITRNTGILYDTTQVIDSYVLNAIMKNANFGFTAATTFFQSVVGLLLLLLANGVVRKVNPDDALF